MIRYRMFLALSLATAAAAQSGIGVPRTGCALDRGGSLRPLYGTLGSFVPGAAAATRVVSAACSERLTLVKTADALELRDGSLRLLVRRPAPEGPARFAFAPNGASAFVYYPKTHALICVNANGSACVAPPSHRCRVRFWGWRARMRAPRRRRTHGHACPVGSPEHTGGRTSGSAICRLPADR